MTRMTAWLVSILIAAIAGKAISARTFAPSSQIQTGRTPPTWPQAYEVEYTLTMPFMSTLQADGLRYPVHIWWDGPAQRYRVDVYDGLDSIVYDNVKGIRWIVHPRIHEIACEYSNGTVGPTVDHQQLMAALGLGGPEPVVPSPTPLPDISQWTHAGTATLGNTEADVWQYSVLNNEKTGQYLFYTAPNGYPLRLDMMGRDLITGAHFDEYILEFTRFKPGTPAASVFVPPATCKAPSEAKQQRQEQQPDEGDHHPRMAARMGALLPAALVGAASPSFLLSDLASQAASNFEANARFVDEHNRANRQPPANHLNGNIPTDNAPTPRYSLSLNHFAHLTHQQWAATMLGLKPNKKAAASASSSSSLANRQGPTYKRVLRDDQLPTKVDWRGTGADGPGVKDQASCGSCWAFSAVGAMQGAWFKATGESLSLSEQQLVDCAWNYRNSGCDGGLIEPAIQYVVDAGGIAQESDYPYTAQNMYCRGAVVSPSSSFPSSPSPPSFPSFPSFPSASFSATSKGPDPAGPPAPLTARFAGYIKVPTRDEAALMEAVALHGPVAVYMDADVATFKWYSEGVFYDAQCGQTLHQMDHGVLLVGYGTSPEGVDYWLIKNSWSKYWGMDGYARVARKGNDCGITTYPLLVVVNGTALAKNLAA